MHEVGMCWRHHTTKQEAREWQRQRYTYAVQHGQVQKGKARNEEKKKKRWGRRGEEAC